MRYEQEDLQKLCRTGLYIFIIVFTSHMSRFRNSELTPVSARKESPASRPFSCRSRSLSIAQLTTLGPKSTRESLNFARCSLGPLLVLLKDIFSSIPSKTHHQILPHHCSNFFIISNTSHCLSEAVGARYVGTWA